MVVFNGCQPASQLSVSHTIHLVLDCVPSVHSKVQVLRHEYHSCHLLDTLSEAAWR